MLEFEDSKEEEYKKLKINMAWEYLEVRVDPKLLNKLYMEGVLEMPYGPGGKRKHYCLADRELTRRIIKEYQNIVDSGAVAEAGEGVPEDLFDIIEGFDDIKKIFKKSIDGAPVSILLVGPPGTAKSLFLLEVERIPGTVVALAGTSTKAGIRDILLEESPRILVIDEMDKVNNSRDLSSLLSWMESGRIISTTHTSREEVHGRGQVFAACNSASRLPPELLDRFLVFRLQEYDEETFMRVVSNVLVKREGVEPSLAAYIAEKTRKFTRSVRDAIKIARLAGSRGEVDQIINVLKKYK